MRVGLVIYGSLDTISGGFLYDRKLVEHLRGSGDEVEVISLPWRSYGRCLVDNFSPSLFRRLRDGTFDVLLQDELNHPSLFWLNQRLRKAASHPIVTIVHLLRCCEPRAAWRNRLYRWVERRYLLGVHGTICNSQATRRASEELTGASSSGIVAYPGRDHLIPTVSKQQVTDRARQPGPLQLLFVGNPSPVKGLLTLIEALARIPKDGWRLKVIGSLTVSPGYVRAVRQYIAGSGLGDNIELLGALTNPQVGAHLEQTHVLAMPSFYEGFGIAYLEGMGFGVPAIASASGAACEFVEDGQNGFLVAPDDVDTLSQRISELARDRERLAGMSLAAMERYTSHPTWHESGSRIRDFLSRLAG